jgi:hypothetical protein
LIYIKDLQVIFESNAYKQTEMPILELSSPYDYTAYLRNTNSIVGDNLNKGRSIFCCYK